MKNYLLQQSISKKLFAIGAMLLVALTFGCSAPMQTTFPNQHYKTLSWEQRKVPMSKKANWNIQGAVSIQHQGKTRMGSFTWRQQQQHYTIQFFGPLNFGSLAIQGMPGRVTLWKSNGNYTAPTPEQLMQQQLGWYLPISNMYYWVRGLPAAGIPAKQFYDHYGHLALLRQQGWQIQFQAFQTVGNVDLPRQIMMENDQLRIKLVVKQWDLPGS
jgi:outer membrane lipoprotein LolB